MSQRKLIIPISFPSHDKNDVYLSLDDVIAKRGIPKVPKNYDKRGITKGSNRKTESTILEKKQVVEDVIGKDDFGDDVLETLRFPKRKFEQIIEDEAVPEECEMEGKRAKLVREDLDPLPEEEDDEIKDILFGPMNAPQTDKIVTLNSDHILPIKRTVNINASALPITRTIKNSSLPPSKLAVAPGKRAKLWNHIGSLLSLSASEPVDLAATESECENDEIPAPVKNPFAVTVPECEKDEIPATPVKNPFA